MNSEGSTARAAEATDVVLRDGSTVSVRPARADDGPGLLAFLRELSAESVARRFAGSLSAETLRARASDMATGDDDGAFGIVATSGDDRIVGHALYARGEDGRAEVAFLVADHLHGQGVGTALLGQLARIASSRGIEVFEASVAPGNHQMLKVFRSSGFSVRVHAEPDEIRVEFPTEMTDTALEAFDRRDWTAAVSAVDTFLRPESVAVIGASRQRGTISGEVFRNLLDFGFAGPVLPVNPGTGFVLECRLLPRRRKRPWPRRAGCHRRACRSRTRRRAGMRAQGCTRAGFTDAGTPPSGFLVQRMADEGVEMIVGVVHDEQFGPVVACGAGGVLIELIKDVSVRLTPLSRHDARQMVDELRTRPLLSGYRGSPARDVPALVDVVLRVGALVDDLPQVRELDLNPILVHEKGATIVDARVRVAPARPEPLPGARQ